MKQIKVSPVVYEMLQEISKKKRVKPDLLIESLAQRKNTSEHDDVSNIQLRHFWRGYNIDLPHKSPL